jgi:hypothetical protein
MQRDKFLKTLKFKFLSSFLTKDCCLSALADVLRRSFPFAQNIQNNFNFFLAFYKDRATLNKPFFFMGEKQERLN